MPDLLTPKTVSERKLLSIFVVLFSLCLILGGLAAYQTPEATGPQQPTITDVVAALPTTTVASSPTRAPTFTPTTPPLPTPTKTSSPSPPTPTNTRVVPEEIYSGGTVQAIKQATEQANNKATVETHLETDRQSAPRAHRPGLSQKLIVAPAPGWY